MSRRWIVWGAFGLLSMAAAPLLSRSLAEPLARRLAAQVGSVAAAIQPEAGTDLEPAPGLPSIDPQDLFIPGAIPSTSASPSHRPGRGSANDRATHPPRKGILVRREVVRAAAKAGVRPSGAPVAANDDHPAGLLVTGVGAAGGLRDGDVITRVGGIAPRSTEDVVAVVAGAYRNKVYSISGEFWRDGEPWNASVELPEPRGANASIQETAATPYRGHTGSKRGGLK